MISIAVGMLMLLMSGSINWRLCAPIALPRAGYAAGAVGHRLIIAGGSYWTPVGKKRTPSTDAFDPKCRCWLRMASMPEAISDSASVVVDGKLYVLGGADNTGSVSDVYLFDGKDWTRRDDLRLPEPRMSGAAVANDHHIYIAGGISAAGNYSSGLRSVWSIDPRHSEGGWKRLADCPCATRMSMGAAVLRGRLLLFGGLRTEGRGQANLADIWSFDFAKQQWTLAGTLPEGRRAMWAATIGDQVYLFGGYTDTFSADILRWHDGAVTRAGTLPDPVADAKVVAIGCHLYTTGGETNIHVRGSHTWDGALPEFCAEEK